MDVVEEIAGALYVELIFIPGVRVHGGISYIAWDGASLWNGFRWLVDEGHYTRWGWFESYVEKNFFIDVISDFFSDADEASNEVDMNETIKCGWVGDDIFCFSAEAYNGCAWADNEMGVDDRVFGQAVDGFFQSFASIVHMTRSMVNALS